MRSNWEDVLGHHCPRFGIDREVLLPIPKPTGYTGADPYKISLQIGREKFHTPWLFVVGRQSAEVPMITVKLRYAGGDLQGAVAKVESMPRQYVVQHESVMKHYWDVHKWPKQILIQYQWEKQASVDLETGLYVLFGSGFVLTLVTALHILQSSKEKVARFVKETVVSNTLPGEVAKVE
ncbi:hypothetical protein L7F22_017331 [Adiantum nelumboides]|nr:hypothetical protein [Adiantum nelumboides]